VSRSPHPLTRGVEVSPSYVCFCFWSLNVNIKHFNVKQFAVGSQGGPAAAWTIILQLISYRDSWNIAASTSAPVQMSLKLQRNIPQTPAKNKQRILKTSLNDSQRLRQKASSEASARNYQAKRRWQFGARHSPFAHDVRVAVMIKCPW